MDYGRVGENVPGTCHSGGSQTSCLCTTSGPLAGSYQPLNRRGELAGRCDQPQKVALVNQDIEFRRAVPPVVLVVKIHPKPDTSLPVIHVDGSGIGGVAVGKKDNQGGGELDPANEFRVLREFQQL